MNTYQARLMSWRGNEVQVEFIGENGTPLIGEILDVDTKNNKFIILTPEGEEILVMGAVKRITLLKEEEGW